MLPTVPLSVILEVCPAMDAVLSSVRYALLHELACVFLMSRLCGRKFEELCEASSWQPQIM